MAKTLQERLDSLRAKKLEYTNMKRQVIGYIDSDDSGMILPPEHMRKRVETISTSGMPVVDIIFNNFEPVSENPEGFFGPRECGENFKRLLAVHPVFVDAESALAGAFMTSFNSYRPARWNPKYPYDHLKPMQEKYQLVHAIGASQHLCQDLQIGLDLGWGGLKEKVRKYQAINSTEQKKADFYAGLLAFIEGCQNWISRTADECFRLAETETDPDAKENLIALGEMNRKLVTEKPETFREAVQWIMWYQIIGRIYNGGGAVGRLDLFLNPFYEKESKAGTLSDEEAIFILCSMLLRDTGYIQIGGYDANGNDTTNKVSYLILEAVHRLRIPSNVGLAIGKGIDRNLLRRGVEMQFEGKCGNPRFVCLDNLIAGFERNGYPFEIASQRTNAGCHWCSLPGTEYSLQDCIKINMATVMNIALEEVAEATETPTMEQIWEVYNKHMDIAVLETAKSMDFQYNHMWDTFPELHCDLLCQDVIERGLDASNGGVKYYNFCLDGSGLAVVADSLAAIDEMVLRQKRYTFKELVAFLKSNWEGEEGEKARLFFSNCDKYGKGGSLADRYAVEVAQAFTAAVKKQPTPEGHNMIPGLFSWANTLSMGKILGATPNGRKAGEPISHGANPNPGFRQDGAATAMSKAIASVQCGWGNTAPMQMEIEPTLGAEEGGVDAIMALLEDHCANGGTLINLNVLDEGKILKAHEHPELYPDLVVRVTGFSTYFASLSPAFRQVVVDRVLSRNMA